MALPKISDEGVQNRTQDTASDRIDALHQATTETGKNKKANNNLGSGNVKDKKQAPLQKEKGYKEGNKDDSTTDEFDIDNEMHTPAALDDDFDDDSYGKRL